MYKICHISSVHMNDDVRIFKKECCSLSENGFEVYFVVSGESFSKNGVSIIGIGARPESRLRRLFWHSRKAVKVAMNIDADLYHLHDPELLLYALKIKKAGKKVVFDSHEIYRYLIRQKPYFTKQIRNIVSLIYSLFEKHVLNKIDGVIVPCSINGKDPFSEIKTSHIYINNYPSLKEFKEVTIRNVEGAACYIGAITEERGIINMVMATYKACTRLLLAGKFTPKSLEDELKRLEEYKNVEYYGFVDRRKAHEILQDSSMGISVIKNIGQYCIADNFPTKVYEYLGAGLPVVVSETPFIKRENEKYKFGITVNPDDVEAISSAIKYLKDNPGEASEMGKRGRMLIEDIYNWESEVNKLIAFYKMILQS